MNEYRIESKLSEMEKGIREMKEDLDNLARTVKPESDMWDSSEIIRKWKISERTLATWRHRGLISYVQLNGKIWYPRIAREEFLQRNLIPIKYGREN
jgi:hypothetical protein